MKIIEKSQKKIRTKMLIFLSIFVILAVMLPFYNENQEKPFSVFRILMTTFTLIWLIANIYSNYVSPGFLIGDVYFHNPAGNANANLWADGYANAGFLGIIIITLLLMLLLWIYDSISKKKDLRVALLLIAMPAYAITNTSLLTSLLSHGWLPALLLMWYFPISNHKDRGKDE